MYSIATREPVVRQAAIGIPDWPSGAAPVRAVLLSDIHVAGPDMPPERLVRTVAQVNRLQPDVVLIAGDFVSDKRTATRRFSAAEAVAPLAALRPRLGTFAVLGNHDHWRSKSDIARALQAARVRLLDNEATTVGPLRLGGVDDAFTGHEDVDGTVRAMRSGAGAKIVLSHSPDVAPEIPADVSLILAGHTHCGQIRLPVIGAVSYMSDHGERYACGLNVEDKRRVLTSAGLGTSILPLRLGTEPEVWVLTLQRP
jgi:predicted MPP superfamily phosphohydrolase